MKISIDIRDNIPPAIALHCVAQTILRGKNTTQYAAITYDTYLGEVWVHRTPYRKTECYVVHKNINNQ